MLPVAVSVKLQVKYRRCDRAFPFTPHLFVIFAFGSLFVLFFVLFLASACVSSDRLPTRSFTLLASSFDSVDR